MSCQFSVLLRKPLVMLCSSLQWHRTSSTQETDGFQVSILSLFFQSCDACCVIWQFWCDEQKLFSSYTQSVASLIYWCWPFRIQIKLRCTILVLTKCMAGYNYKEANFSFRNSRKSVNLAWNVCVKRIKTKQSMWVC